MHYSLALVTLCVLSNALASFEKPPVWHVRFVDTVGTNFLFRGGSPEVPLFNHTVLVRSIQLAALNSNVTLPTRFLIHVVNLESLTSIDAPHVLAEHDFYAQNPSLGNFSFWNIVGCAGNPALSSFDKNRAWLASSMRVWDADRLRERVSMLRMWLERVNSLPTILYIHCDCGCDRTGEVAGAYMLTYMQHIYSFSDIVALNDSIEPPPPGLMVCQNLWAMQWYCLSLNRTDCLAKSYACDASGMK
jgi:hypothetical protein